MIEWFTMIRIIMRSFTIWITKFKIQSSIFYNKRIGMCKHFIMQLINELESLLQIEPYQREE